MRIKHHFMLAAAALSAFIFGAPLAPDMTAAAHTPYGYESPRRSRVSTKTKPGGKGGVSSHRKLKIKFYMSK